MPRVGVAYRFDVAEDIERNIGRFDVLEFLVDHYLRAGDFERRRADEIAARVPSLVHGVRLSLGSAERPPSAYLDRVAVALDRLGAAHYSEHLAFTRVRGVEVDELLPIPYDAEAFDIVAQNIEYVSARIGVPLLIENPPKAFLYGDEAMSEGEFFNRLHRETGVRFLLDIENAYADQVNWGVSADSLLATLDAGAVEAIHLAGGTWRDNMYVDDHAHDIPEEVFGLLDQSLRKFRPLDIVVERDGGYADAEVLVSEVARVRERIMRARVEVADVEPA